MTSGARLLMERDEDETRERWVTVGREVSNPYGRDEQAWWANPVHTTPSGEIRVLLRPGKKDIGVQEMRDQMYALHQTKF